MLHLDALSSHEEALLTDTDPARPSRIAGQKAAFWQAWPLYARASMVHGAYVKYDELALNRPERMPLPEAFEPPDPIRPMREVVERAFSEQAPPEPSLFEVDARVERALEICTPQYFLRNIPRTERVVEDWLEFEREAQERRDYEALLDEVRRARVEPPELIARWGFEELRDWVAEHRRLFVDTEWTRHFGRELAKDLTGPIWRYDPDARPAPEDQA